MLTKKASTTTRMTTTPSPGKNYTNVVRTKESTSGLRLKAATSSPEVGLVSHHMSSSWINFSLDMLFIRSGWKEAYDNKGDEDRAKAALRHGTGKDGEDGQRYVGLSQEQKILDWLHDCYFASVAGDAPAFEAWPTHEGQFRICSHPLGQVNFCRLSPA